MAFIRILLPPCTFACCEPQYPSKSGSRNDHSLLLPVRISCISFGRGSTFRARNQGLCNEHQNLLKSHGSDRFVLLHPTLHFT